MATELDRFADILLKAMPPPAKKTRITFRTYLDPEPVIDDLAENEELLHIVLVPLERPASRPMPDLGAQRTYGEEREPDLEVETPSKLEAIMEAMRDIEL